jgi:6-pyruvoyl-tetrahydropterin synthase
MGKPEGKGLLRRHGHRWKVTIKHLEKELGQEGMDWINPLKTKRICFI